MLEISKERLAELKNRFYGKKVAVIGDLMLDGYLWGNVHRVSPEAPVPVVEIDEEFFRFGGAANVALNILKLGGIPFPIGITGNDLNGTIFRNLLKENNITDEGIISDSTRPTTTKTRVIANNQHVVRIDKENKFPIGQAAEKQIITLIKDNFRGFDAIIMEDYNKGVLTGNIISTVISTAKEKDTIITVDPKFLNFFSYNGVTVFKPNRKETEDALRMIIRTEEDLEKAGRTLLEKINSKYALITLGEGGMAIFENGKPHVKIATKARKVADVSGAGDTVISTLTMALASGADIYESAYLANFAGGLVCEDVGIVPIELDKLFLSASEEGE
jgi:D-glycero-beta-D-manno-heptose-7-phosphate kinase